MDLLSLGSLIASYSEDERRIGHLFKTLLRDWVMNPYYSDLYFRQVADEIICRPDFIDLHDDLETTLKETFAFHPSAELTKAEMVQEPASQYDDPLPADFAGFSYHIPVQNWEQRALPKPFRRRIDLVLESNCPDYGYISRALKSLVMYAFVPRKIKNRSITPLFKDKIQPILELCEDKERKLVAFIGRLALRSLKHTGQENKVILGTIEHFEDRLKSLFHILHILHDLHNFTEY